MTMLPQGPGSGPLNGGTLGRIKSFDEEPNLLLHFVGATRRQPCLQEQ